MSAIVFARVRRILVAALAPALTMMGSACSNVPAVGDLVPQAPKLELRTLPTSPVRVLGPPALIGPDGSCAATGADEFPGSGIALRMSECDVVQRAGAPDNVDISTNPSGQRATVLTFQQGERAGIYRFVSGRLVSIERSGEPPAPERPAKKKTPKKAAATARQ